MTRPFSIGLTGGIGSGKSSVAGILHDLGAEVVSGDQLGREVLEEDRELRAELISRWGNQIVRENGDLNRRRIGELIFATVDDAKWLTDRTFPGIHAKWLAQLEQTSSRAIVFDAALIFEWGIEREFNLMLTVICAEEIAISRLGGRFSSEEFLSRRAAQVADEVKIGKSDCVIENNGTIEELRNKVVRLWETRIATHL